MHSLRRGRGAVALAPYLGITCRPLAPDSRGIYGTTARSSGEASRAANEAIAEKPRPPSTPRPLEFLDVPYYEGEDACDKKHRLDVYMPAAPFPRPRSRTCLFVHGGSWQRGDRRHPSIPDQVYGNVGRAFARAGMVGLVMSYRLAPGVQHPEQVRDIARAVSWVKENVSRYGGDPRDLVLVGHSAGAHLAALCLSDAQWLGEQGLTSTAQPLPRDTAAASSAPVIDVDSERNYGLTRVGITRDTREKQSPGVTSTKTARQTVTSGRNFDTNERLATPKRQPDVTSQPSIAVKRAPPRPPIPKSSSNRSLPSLMISGFVGISGVYDIPRMAGNVVGAMLARAAFGDERKAWRRVSPVHCVRAAGRAATIAVSQLSTSGTGSPAILGFDGRQNAMNVSTAGPGAVRGSQHLFVDGGVDVKVEESVVQEAAGGKSEISELSDTLVQEEVGFVDSDGFPRSTTIRKHEGLGREKRRDRQREGRKAEHTKGEGAHTPNPGLWVGERELPASPIDTDERVPLSTASLLSSCPLATVDVLLLTASSDFHLREDAEALAAALDRTRHEMAATKVARIRSSAPQAEIAEAEGTKTAMGFRTEEADRQKQDERNDDEDDGRGEGRPKEKEAVGGGSVRHVYIEGEDHVSTIVSFGEPGKETSDTVLEFIRGLPKPSRTPR